MGVVVKQTLLPMKVFLNWSDLTREDMFTDKATYVRSPSLSDVSSNRNRRLNDTQRYLQ